MRKYFGTDGVRGLANNELTPELAFKLGRFGGHVLKQKYGQEDGEQPTCLVARDTRISGKMLGHALIAGLLSVGVEVMDLGVITTPAVSYLIRHTGAVAGVMISASHNPAPDNGIKFFGSDGTKLSDDEEEIIESYIDGDQADDLPRPSAEGLGRYSQFPEGASQYINFLEDTIPSDLSGLKVVVDGANGAASRLINQLFADLDADFETLGTSPDGLNINVNVGSTHPEKLAERVKEVGADAGVAFDGDADRCIAVDENGNLIDGDYIMYLCGKALDQKGQLKDHTIVSTVMSNLGFHKAVEAADMKAAITKVGDRYVAEEMRAHDYTIGGEQSGHIIFSEYAKTGDGLLTGLQLLSVLKESGKTLSELASEVTSYPQTLVNVKVTREGRDEAMADADVKAAIDAVEAEMAGDGRVLVRPSGTENLLRVMVEAKTDELADEYAERIANVVREHYGI